MFCLSWILFGFQNYKLHSTYYILMRLRVLLTREWGKKWDWKHFDYQDLNAHQIRSKYFTQNLNFVRSSTARIHTIRYMVSNNGTTYQTICQTICYRLNNAVSFICVCCSTSFSLDFHFSPFKVVSDAACLCVRASIWEFVHLLHLFRMCDEKMPTATSAAAAAVAAAAKIAASPWKPQVISVFRN